VVLVVVVVLLLLVVLVVANVDNRDVDTGVVALNTDAEQKY